MRHFRGNYSLWWRLCMALSLGLLLGLCKIVAQSNGSTVRFALTLDNIMRGPELYGWEPQEVRWSGDGQKIYFTWKQASDNPESPRDTYFVYRDRGVPIKLNEEETRLAPPPNGASTRDRKRTVYTRDGDLYLYDFATDKARQLTKTADAESNPHFTKDEKRVAFTRGGNLYTLALEGGLIEQLTEIESAENPPATGGDGRGKGPRAAEQKNASKDGKKTQTSQDFLEKQEKELIQAVRDRLRLKDAEDGRHKREHPRKPFTLEARQRLGRLVLCPDETCVLAMIDERPEGGKRDNVPNYVTESGYTEEIPGRTNVGDSQPHDRVLLLDVESGEGRWLDAGLAPREVEFDTLVFNPQGTQAVLLARSVDNKDRWILALDTAGAKARVVFTDHDDAWIGGPGEETLGWLHNGTEIFFESEKDGFAHLYKSAVEGGDARQLTSGRFEVSDVRLSNDGSRFYFTSNEESASVKQLYTVLTDGGARNRITSAAGSHRAVLSPDERLAADVYSYVNKPPELYAIENQPGAEMDNKRTASPSRDFFDYAWLDTPVVEVPARDGAKIPARFFKPANYQLGGPAVVFVHGAGYLQNVGKFWTSSYAHEYLFHHFLMEHGYMVLDMDYRASAGRGRDWRTGIYRHMGGKDLDDNVDGARWLVEQGADAKRIGIYGGSYGGFITLMAMFTTPDVFAAGAALRPVTDWAHYNNGYTSNILNTPQADEEAYRKSSPLYFAEGLKGALLICHGMVDTNVFFQDTVRLVQRLIELRKENWSVSVYPVENHGFVKASSWADEYKRIFQLFETNLKK